MDQDDNPAAKDPVLVMMANRKKAARIRQLAAVQEEYRAVESDTWMTSTQKSQYDSDQLAYVDKYRNEFEDQREDGQNASDEEGQDHFNEQLSSVAKESVLNFDATSTVIQERKIGDFASTIDADEIKNRYFRNYRTNETLPIFSRRDSVMTAIRTYSVVIIQGKTGCGKSTQVPMYILEDSLLANKINFAPVIYVTQPRRIAAKSIAERVSREHGWDVGSVVGYQVGLEKVVSPHTVLVYCTAGVLLQKLIREKSVDKISHIIIDEVHERDADTDLLLMVIKTLMLKEDVVFRLVIMSATMDREKLRKYFTFRTSFGHRAYTTPAICTVGEEGNQYARNEVKIAYIDNMPFKSQAIEMPEFKADEPELHDACLQVAANLISEAIPKLEHYSERSKSTLVFLPGMSEIHRLHKLLPSDPTLEIIPVHSCLSVHDQAKVFLPLEKNRRKVILATNIAESSITVIDCGFVIDFCLTKTLVKDPVTRFPTLKLQWITRDRGTQRAGRTGRCCSGVVFRMVPRFFYSKLSEYATPELLTAPLELSVLRVKSFGMGIIEAQFARVMDPPPANEIRTAILELKQIGALAATYEGKINRLDGDLTELGEKISSLPIDVHLSKLIVMGHLFNILEPAIIVAACLSTNRTVVKQMYGNTMDTYRNKLLRANGSCSDLFVSLDVYRLFEEQVLNYGKNYAHMEQWCRERNLDDRKLYEVSNLIVELKGRLEESNIKFIEQPERHRDELEDELMLKIAFCAAFYPNYFLNKTIDMDRVNRELQGFDYKRTLVISSIPNGQAPLYRNQILDILNSQNLCIGADYIADHHRAYLVLQDQKMAKDKTNHPEVIGSSGILQTTEDIPEAMYLALKFGQDEHLRVREYQMTAAYERGKYYEEERDRLAKARTPEDKTKFFPYLTKIVDDDPEESHNDLYCVVKSNQQVEQEDAETLRDMISYESKFLECTMKPMENIVFKSEPKRLNGPESPTTLQFVSVLEKSKCFTVKIDRQSVNCITINPNPAVPRRQMLVAASVAQNIAGGVTARDTTLMPNIRGLHTLMALMFSQHVRLIYDESTRCIVGAVFGLGWSTEGQSFDKSYEIEMAFDTLITDKDIELINIIRFGLNKLIDYTKVVDPGRPFGERQDRVRQAIFALIKKRRMPRPEADILCKDGFVLESELSPGLFMPPISSSKKYTAADFFSSINKNLRKLQSIYESKEKVPEGGIHCLLCRSEVNIFSKDVRLHLDDIEHKQNIKLRDEFKKLDL